MTTAPDLEEHRQDLKRRGFKLMSKEEQIKKLKSMGYTLFPLIKDKKEPTREATGWRQCGPLSFPLSALIEGNYAVAAKAGDLFIDVDPRHFKEGDRPLARLVEAVGPLYTFAVRTGGGGLHLYFSKPPDIKTAYTLSAYPGIEFRREGMYIVGPDCVHPDTKKIYDVVKDIPVSPLPPKLLELLKISEVPFSELKKDGGKNVEYKSDGGTQNRFVDYLLLAPLSGSYKIACVGRDYGLPPAITLELMLAHWNPRREGPRAPAEVEAKVTHAYKYARGGAGDKHPAADFTVIPQTENEKARGKKEEIVWQLSQNGQIVKCFYNLLNYLKLPEGGLDGVFGFNEFTGQVEFVAPAPWHKGKMPGSPLVQDKDLALLKGYLAVKHAFEQTVGNISEAMTVVAHANNFHPVREYLQGLKWDGKPRVDQWLQTYAGALDSQYVRAAGRKTLCAAVARVLRPGIKFDQVLTLEGAQGAGKSMLCAALGGEWAADFPVDPQAPDTVAAMQGKWFVELAELSILSRKVEMSALKAFITRRVDKVRVAYGRLHQEYPRQSVFIGSINPEADNGYLSDPTGNRRWWPVEVSDRIDFMGVRRDRDQLFAEAVEIFKKGENLYMDNKSLEGDAKAVVDARHPEHAWTDRISAWLNDPTPGNGSGKGREFVTAREIFIDAMGGIDKQLTRKEILSIASVMRSLGWESVTQRQGERVVRGYVRGGEKDKGNTTLEGLI
jgi:predicted P-loop ATPase